MIPDVVIISVILCEVSIFKERNDSGLFYMNIFRIY